MSNHRREIRNLLAAIVVPAAAIAAVLLALPRIAMALVWEASKACRLHGK